MSKNVLKSFQTSFELVLRYFSEKNIAQCTLEGRNMEKHQKNGKTFIYFSKCPKKFPEKLKQVLIMLRGSFFGKKIWPVTLDGRNLEKFEKKIEKNLKFQKCPKTFLKVSKQVLKLFWGDFFGKTCPVHPGESKLGKTPKNWKIFQFFKMPKKRSQKQSNMFWTCFEVSVSVKFVPCAPWRFE